MVTCKTSSDIDANCNTVTMHAKELDFISALYKTSDGDVIATTDVSLIYKHSRLYSSDLVGLIITFLFFVLLLTITLF